MSGRFGKTPRGCRFARQRPGLGERPGTVYDGPPREAAHLLSRTRSISAVAAALCGPGLDTTVIELIDSGPEGAHYIHGEIEIGALRLTTRIDIGDFGSGVLHPVAGALIAALERRTAPFRYG